MADTSGCVEIPCDAQYEACTEAGLSPFVQGSCEENLYCLPTTDTTGYCMLPCDGETIPPHAVMTSVTKILPVGSVTRTMLCGMSHAVTT